jgi:uncharacterized damage-inducible protein DinB
MMSVCALTCAEMLAYNEDASKRWENWFARNPAAFDLPCDVMNVGTVRMLVQHIFAVELRFSQRLLNEPPADYANLPTDTLEQLISIHKTAAANYETFLATANGPVMEEVIELVTRTAGTLRASRRSVFVHAMFHSVRHWAQLATLLRQQEMKTDWPQDYLFYAMVK